MGDASTGGGPVTDGGALRPYVEEDIDAVLDVWYRASLIAHPFMSAEFLADERREIAETWLPMAEMKVHEVDGRVVGFIAMIGNEVGGIFVDPDFQGRGIGRALMDDAAETRPHLELDVFEANSIGRRFYAAYGFRLVGSSTEETSGRIQLRLRFD